MAASDNVVPAPRDIVNYSMGICSAYIAVQLKESCCDPVCFFSDTKREDKDTYRFGYEVAERWNLNLCEVSDGRDLWDVWRAQTIIPARQIAQCSITMKIKPSQRFLQNWPADMPARVAYGYDLGEEDRAEKLLSHWSLGSHLTPWFPLIEWRVSKAQCFGFFLKEGVDAPRVYAYRQNANCRVCKNFRRADFIALAYHDREAFDEAVAFEREAQRCPSRVGGCRTTYCCRNCRLQKQSPAAKGVVNSI